MILEGRAYHSAPGSDRLIQGVAQCFVQEKMDSKYAFQCLDGLCQAPAQSAKYQNLPTVIQNKQESDRRTKRCLQYITTIFKRRTLYRKTFVKMKSSALKTMKDFSNTTS